MARNKSIDEKIKAAKKKKEQYENEMKRLLQQQNVQERKARTKRLCRRGGYLEKILPDTIPLTDEQFDLFLNKTLLTEFTRRTLAAIQSGQLKPVEKPVEPAQGGNVPVAKKENPQGGNSNASGSAGGARQAG